MADILEVQKHLEFQGYTIQTLEQGKHYRATHDRFLNFLFKAYRGGVLFTIIFRGSAHGKALREEFLSLVNELNTNASVARAYLDSDTDFIFEAYCPLPYERAAFASFLDVWHADTALVFQIETFKEFLD